MSNGFTCPLQSPNANFWELMSWNHQSHKQTSYPPGKYIIESQSSCAKETDNRTSSSLCIIYSSCKSDQIFSALLSFLPEENTPEPWPVRWCLHTLAGTTLPLNLLLQSLQPLQLKLTHKHYQIHNVSGDMPAVFNNTGHHQINQIHRNAAKSWVGLYFT